MRLPIPDGYVRVRQGSAFAVVVESCSKTIEGILAQSSIYDWASAQTDRREYKGRGAAYGVTLPDCDLRVVVRHARHGGVFASVLKDVFLVSTRAPRELALSLFLQRVGIATPVVVGYAAYSVAPLVWRADVLTVEVPNTEDLRAFLARTDDPAQRMEAWRAAAQLLQRLTLVGVWHPDLNAKNLLILRGNNAAGGAGSTYVAIVLDIDRVRLVVPGDPQLTEANLQRLVRSVRKESRDQTNGPLVQERELTDLATLVRAPLPASSQATG